MSAASVAVVVTSGERHEGKAGMVLFAGKTVHVIHARALCVYLGAKRRYINTLPFLFLNDRRVPDESREGEFQTVEPASEKAGRP